MTANRTRSGRTADAYVALFWDIDGTLLTTARAGVFALERALRDVCAVDFDLQGLVTAGLTDAEVAALALGTAGFEASAEHVDAFLRAYELHLPECLHRRRGHVMAGVREALGALQHRDDVRSFLLTGNTPIGAAAKLAHYGLDAFFLDRSGGFCLGLGSRTEIARRACALASEARAIYVIGDTPHDIACGKAIGAQTVAVASGSFSVPELAEHAPSILLPRIPNAAAFAGLLGLSND